MRPQLLPTLLPICVLPCLVWLPAAGAQVPLRDIELTGPNRSSEPGQFVTMNGFTYFSAEGVYGRELYRTDGTAAGTSVVKDIEPDGSSTPESLTVVGNTLYFTAYTTETGRELWATDGTTAGTRLVREVRPGPGDGASPITDLVSFAGYLFFVADDGQNGREVWFSLGTPATTALFLDVAPGPNSSQPRYLTPASSAFGNALWWKADDGVHGEELWIWDTLTAPRMVVDLEPGMAGSSPYQLTPFQGALLFIAATSLGGYELWRSTGTPAGTQIVIDAWPGSGSSSPEGLHIVGNRAFYTCDNGQIGRELWQTDGTTAGSQPVADLTPGRVDSVIDWIIGYDGDVYFVFHNSANFGSELWRSDGTPGNTAMVRDLLPGPSSSFPTSLTVIASGPTASGTLCFVASDGVRGREVWAYDPLSGMRMVGDIRPGSLSSTPTELAHIGGSLYFSADDGVRGAEPWRLPSASQVVQLLADINPPVGGSMPRWFTPLSPERFVFQASTAAAGSELWVSDGTATGTVLVADIRPGSQGSSPWHFAALGGRALFAAEDSAAGFELWSTDGTPTGTQRVLDIRPGGIGSGPILLRAALGRVFFAANNGTSGVELWTSDGTAVGTRLVVDLEPGAGDSFPRPLGEIGGRLLFAAYTSAFGHELWETDGTAAGTRLLRDISPGAGGSLADNGVVMGGFLWFTADDGGGTALWRSDGTTAGTVLVERVAAEHLTATRDALFFTVTTLSTGKELWTSDGTPNGARMVVELWAGLVSGLPTHPDLTPAGTGNVVVFAARDPAHGLRLWRSDGTAVGTGPLGPIGLPGLGAVSISGMRLCGARIAFEAFAGPQSGSEPWTVDVAVAGGSVAVAYGAGCAGSNGWPPRLNAGDAPFVGNAAFRFDIADAAPGAPILLMLSTGRAAIPVGPCTLLVAPPWINLPGIANSQGRAVIGVPIPPAPELRGAYLPWQALAIDTGGALLGLFALTGGVETVLGQ